MILQSQVHLAVGATDEYACVVRDARAEKTDGHIVRMGKDPGLHMSRALQPCLWLKHPYIPYDARDERYRRGGGRDQTLCFGPLDIGVLA